MLDDKINIADSSGKKIDREGKILISALDNKELVISKIMIPSPSSVSRSASISFPSRVIKSISSSLC